MDTSLRYNKWKSNLVLRHAKWFSPSFTTLSTNSTIVLLVVMRKGHLNTFFTKHPNTNICKNIFACLFSVHDNIIALSRHGGVCLTRLRFDRLLPSSCNVNEICRPGQKQ